MAFITLKKTDKYQIATNFMANEFFSTSPGVTEHPLEKKLVDVSQALRTYYGKPISIVSTYRTTSHNLTVGGAINSQHLKGNAVDLTTVMKVDGKWVFDEVAFKKLADELRIYKHNHPAIKSLGVGGIGIYENFIHLDFGGAGRYWDEAKGNYIGENLERGEKTSVFNGKNIIIVGVLGLATYGVVEYFRRQKKHKNG